MTMFPFLPAVPGCAFICSYDYAGSLCPPSPKPQNTLRTSLSREDPYSVAIGLKEAGAAATADSTTYFFTMMGTFVDQSIAWIACYNNRSNNVALVWQEYRGNSRYPVDYN